MTDEEVEDFIHTHKLYNKAADFPWKQTENIKMAIVYKRNMLCVNIKYKIMQTRWQDGLLDKKLQNDL